MTVVPMPARGEWYPDARGGADERALRVSWHAERGCVVLSTWKDGACTGTVRLLPEDAARVVSQLVHGLAEVAGRPAPAGRHEAEVLGV